MTPVDLEPATRRLADLVANVPEDRLAGPTPCEDMSLAALVDHVAGLTTAFTVAATKTFDEGAGSQGPSAEASRLAPDFRTSIPAGLARLANAWRSPEAWQGMTKAGGFDMPGEMAGLVALDELVLHGWDVARASGQSFEVEPEVLEAVHSFVEGFSSPDAAASREGLFGPVVPVPDDAPLLDRVLGLSGRDPGWRPA